MEPDKKQRLLAAATAILAAVPGRELSIVLLNKALFYLDLAALRDFGRTATGNTYVALPMGPVVAKYRKRLVEPLTAAGAAVQRSSGLAKPVKLVDGFQSPWTLGQEGALVDRIARWSATLSATEASDLSHQNPGWLLARRRGQLPSGKVQPRPIRMGIAMQQILDHDPWLDADGPAHVWERARHPGIPWT